MERRMVSQKGYEALETAWIDAYPFLLLIGVKQSKYILQCLTRYRCPDEPGVLGSDPHQPNPKDSPNSAI